MTQVALRRAGNATLFLKFDMGKVIVAHADARGIPTITLCNGSKESLSDWLSSAEQHEVEEVERLEFLGLWIGLAVL
jgi:hypothetical protein